MQRKSKSTRRLKTPYSKNYTSAVRLAQKLQPSDPTLLDTLYSVTSGVAYFTRESSKYLINRYYSNGQDETENDNNAYSLKDDRKHIHARFAAIDAMTRKVELKQARESLEQHSDSIKIYLADLKSEKQSVAFHKKIDALEHHVRVVLAEQDSSIIVEKLSQIEEQVIAIKEKKKELDKKAKAFKEAKKDVPERLHEMQLACLKKIDLLLIDKVELLPELIRDHAQRRVDLFFHLMIAVYKQKLVIERGKTNKQHGNGSKKTGTAACHASLLPNPVARPADISFSAKARSLLSFSLFSTGSVATINVDADTFLKDTHFEDELNSTTELPKIVNDFDCHLEGKWIKSNAVNASVGILNRVSLGEINPIQGLREFGEVMKLFFYHMQYKYVIGEPKYANTAQVLYPKALAHVWQYEREGTMRIFNGKNWEPDPNFVYLKLGLQNRTTVQKLASLISDSQIERRILEIQNEIYQNESSLVKRNSK